MIILFKHFTKIDAVFNIQIPVMSQVSCKVL